MNQYLIKMKYQAHFNHRPSPGESKFAPSQTAQGQSYSVQEALNRIQRGLPVPSRNYAYQDEGEIDPPMRMNDLTDLDRAKSQLHEINQKKHEAAAAYKAKKAAEDAARKNADPASPGT